MASVMHETNRVEFAAFSQTQDIRHGLPAHAYSSESFFERECHALFPQGWVFVAFAHTLANPGDVRPIKVAGQPVLLVRDADGEVRAFQNVCRHRCARLVEEPGNAGRQLVCPYHNWVYGLDGSLKVAPFFGGRNNRPPEGFDPLKNGLAPVRCEVWHDWIFVNLDGQAEDFDDYAAPLFARMDGIDFDQLTLVGTIDLGEVETNWKFLMENFIEPYHVPVVHPSTTEQPLADHKTFIDGRCLGCVVDLDDTQVRADTLNVSSRYLTLFPNFVVGRYAPDQLGVHLNTPISAGVTRQWRAIYLTNGETASEERASQLKDLWRAVHLEDHDVCKRLQRGRSAPIAAEGGVLSPYWEDSLRRFQELVVEAVSRPPGQPDTANTSN